MLRVVSPTCRRARTGPRIAIQVQPSPSRISFVSGPAVQSAPLSSRLCLPCCQSRYKTAGPLPSTGVTRLPRYYQPLRHPLACQPISRCSRLYDLPCSADFSTGRGGLLQLLSASSSPCRRYHPARVSQRFSQSALRHAAFVLRKRTRPPDLMCSRGYLCVHSRYGPVTRRPPFTVAVSMGFSSSVSLLPAIQATGLWLLPRRVCSPAERASLCWTHPRTIGFSRRLPPTAAETPQDRAPVPPHDATA